MTIIKCPECKSTNIKKEGTAWRKRQKIQRYYCDDCGRHFR